MPAFTRRLRFEPVSLGALGIAITALYGAVLLDPSMARSVDGAVAAFEALTPTRVAPALSSDSWIDITPPSTAADTSARTGIAAINGVAAVTPPPSVAHIDNLFRRVDYRLEGVRLGELAVPRVLLQQVPADLATVVSAAERKRLFIQLALPLVLQVNEYIEADRARLIGLDNELAATGAIAKAGDRAWLAGLASRYGLESVDMAALLRRVDVVPPSLALAQGAEESGWGTSRFVREGNAIFGQRTFIVGSGLVPENRDEDLIHEVRTFDQLLGSVASYMANLNTHFAYDRFREMRARQRQSPGSLDSIALAGALERYSERGDAYIAAIRLIIESNDLRAYDRARLSDGDVVAINEPAI